LLLGVCTALALPLPTADAGTSSAQTLAAARQTLNGAARQRMLAQRMVKAWCLLGLDDRNAGARAQLFESIERFEGQLVELDVLAQAHGSLAVAVQQLKSSWVPFEAIVSGPIKRTAAPELLQKDRRLAEAADQVVQQIVQLTATPNSRLVDLAGRQRMLSQRLLKAYMLLAWGIQDPHIHEEFITSWNAFEETLMMLRGLTENTPQLHQALTDTDEQWRWMKSAISLRDEQRYFPGIVDDAGEKILIALERVTELYEQMVLTEGKP